MSRIKDENAHDRYEIRFGPEVLNAFEHLDDALEMLLDETSDYPSSACVYDAHEQRRYDREEAPAIIADLRDDSWKVYPA